MTTCGTTSLRILLAITLTGSKMAQIKSREEILKEYGLPAAGPGIIHPAMMHRWRVVLGSDLITLQATSCLINMKKGEITLAVEQPAAHAQAMLKEIGRLGRFKHDIFIELLDGCYEVLGTIGGYAELVDHEFLLDYSKNGVATHKLIFKYTPSV